MVQRSASVILGNRNPDTRSHEVNKACQSNNEIPARRSKPSPSALPPSALELLERLEQLRAMAHGMRIVAPDALEACGMGIDTPADLARASALLAQAGV